MIISPMLRLARKAEPASPINVAPRNPAEPIMGSGGVGGYFGARLALGGCDVDFVASSPRPESFSPPTDTRAESPQTVPLCVSFVKELKAERHRLDRAIAALDGANTTARATVGTEEAASEGASAPRKRHHISAAGRKRLSVMMKRRWAQGRKKSSAGQK